MCEKTTTVEPPIQNQNYLSCFKFCKTHFPNIFSFRGEDNLFAMDKIAGSNVSFIQRFWIISGPKLRLGWSGIPIDYTAGEPHCTVWLPPQSPWLPAPGGEDRACRVQGPPPTRDGLHEPPEGHEDGLADQGGSGQTGGHHGEESSENYGKEETGGKSTSQRSKFGIDSVMGDTIWNVHMSGYLLTLCIITLIPEAFHWSSFILQYFSG